jgi:flagellar basal-body rod modification protein FlgD
MVDAIAPSVSATADSTPDTRSQATKTALDKEAFLKLLVAQLAHQDPLKPMEGTEFVAQLSQFAMVEQSISQSQKLDLLSSQMGGIANNEATRLVGTTVTVRGKSLAFDGLTATSANVTLAGPAQDVSVNVRDSNGRIVRTLNLGARGPGPVQVQWDGKDGAGATAARGAYSFDVRATDANGGPVTVSQEVTGRVRRVSYEKGYPELILDSGATAPISDLLSVAETPSR